MKKYLPSFLVLLLGLWCGLLLPMGALVEAETKNPAKTLFDGEFQQPNDISVPYGAPNDLRGFILSVVGDFKNVVYIIAVLAIVVAGVRIVSAVDNEDEIGNQKKVLIGVGVGIVVMNMADVIVNTLYQNRGTPASDPRIAAMKFQTLIVERILDFMMSFIAAIAVFMVVMAGFRMITAAGDEGKQKEQRFVLIQAIVGLMLVLLAQPIVKAVYGYKSFNVFDREFPNPNLAFGIQVLVQIMNYLLSFFFIGAVVMLIYAGFLMVAHFGDDSRSDTAKNIIKYVVISMVIAISSYSLVAWLVTLTP
jgi:hypothetical protein